MGNSLLNLLVLLLFFISSFNPLLTSSSASRFMCHPHQSHALLQFKSTFSIDSHAFWWCGGSSYPKTESWEESTDCCSSWNGVTCDEVTGHVIELDLSCSQLSGKLPHTLSYCRFLEVVDVGNNMIGDVFPHWLEVLSTLQILVLRSNKFFGSVNGFKSRVFFSNLRILDVSDNNLSGKLPSKLINNLESMMNVHGGSEYMEASNISGSGISYYSMTITAKGTELIYVKILSILAVIDFSRNKFEDHIPQVIGKLRLLKGLNLSHNFLSGHIPPSMGGLVNLEWLDLSSNKLIGHIPQQLAEMSFLEVLDLSHNHLDGPIPKGKQFNTFGNDSYQGNSGLCGFPLSKACGTNKEAPSEKNGASMASASGFNWEGAYMGYGCGIVFGLSMGYLVFSTGSPKWFVRMVEGKQRRGRSKKSSHNKRRARR